MTEVFMFGCLEQAGHFLRSKMGSIVFPPPDPWKNDLDGGLLGPQYKTDTAPTGKFVVAKKEGWTAISFWDRSGGDKRPGCNTAFLAHADISSDELIALAKEQWPEVFSRKGFIPLQPS